MKTPQSSPLDTIAARIVALAVAATMAGLLAIIHWDRLFPPPLPAGIAAGDPAAACIAQRHAEIDTRLREGVFQPAQAALFKTRAEAMCRAETGAGPVPGLPGLTPTPLR